jgi:uncharacterized protein (DUF924 family)
MTAPALPREAGEVLEFWFGTGEALGKQRPEWFRKDPKFDDEIGGRFADVHGRASRGELDAWRQTPESMLALLVILDQFSRNLYRDDARAFAQDERALGCAKEALLRGDDLALLPVQRQFVYLPFEHSEDLADQERGVELMRSLEAFEETRGIVTWAERHRDIIERFGRFPHRNACLGRETTPQEAAFLEQPGSRF